MPSRFSRCNGVRDEGGWGEVSPCRLLRYIHGNQEDMGPILDYTKARETLNETNIMSILDLNLHSITIMAWKMLTVSIYLLKLFGLHTRGISKWTLPTRYGNPHYLTTARTQSGNPDPQVLHWEVPACLNIIEGKFVKILSCYLNTRYQSGNPDP